MPNPPVAYVGANPPLYRSHRRPVSKRWTCCCFFGEKKFPRPPDESQTPRKRVCCNSTKLEWCQFFYHNLVRKLALCAVALDPEERSLFGPTRSLNPKLWYLTWTSEKFKLKLHTQSEIKKKPQKQRGKRPSPRPPVALPFRWHPVAGSRAKRAPGGGGGGGIRKLVEPYRSRNS